MGMKKGLVLTASITTGITNHRIVDGLQKIYKHKIPKFLNQAIPLDIEVHTFTASQINLDQQYRLIIKKFISGLSMMLYLPLKLTINT